MLRRWFAFCVLLLLGALLLAGCRQGPGELTLYGVQTGKSDCLVFLLPNGETLLVDTGLKDTYDQVAQVLELAGVKEIHHLVLTHGHKDHIGGLKKLAKAYEIGTIYTNAYDKATYNDSERETIAASCGQWVRVKAGDSLSLGGVEAEILAPQRAYSDEEDDNNNSLVVRLSHGDVRFLLMGDATFLIEEALLDQGADVAADFLKAGRHGKADANTQAFLEAVSPQVAYLTGNREDDPDSPDPGVLSRLEALGVQSYVNQGEHLAICWRSDGESLTSGEYIYE